MLFKGAQKSKPLVYAVIVAVVTGSVSLTSKVLASESHLIASASEEPATVSTLKTSEPMSSANSSSEDTRASSSASTSQESTTVGILEDAPPSAPTEDEPAPLAAFVEPTETPKPEAPLSEEDLMRRLDEPFRMQEYRPNYIISGKPDTKVQFSFLFRTLKNYSLYLGFTQTIFWELGRKDSNPFSDINFHPELFYKFKFEEAWIRQLHLGYAHTSNGMPKTESRSMDEIFVLLGRGSQTRIGTVEMQLRLRYILPDSLSDNKDLRDYYGPAVLRLNLTRLGRRLFYSEQFFIEYYNGGKWADDFSKSSVRVSFRFKLFESLSAPKFFIQYFNGYGENLQNYNLKDESFRIGLSIGGDYLN